MTRIRLTDLLQQFGRRLRASTQDHGHTRELGLSASPISTTTRRLSPVLLLTALLALPAYADVSDAWHTSRIKEPVFQSEVHVVQAGREHAKTVVLIHGLGPNGHRDWRHVIPVLAQHYHVITFDLPGFGSSGAPAGVYSPHNFARVVNWLVREIDDGPVSVVGHSMGGAVALRYAAEYPDSVETLVLVDAAGILERTVFLQYASNRMLEQLDVSPALESVTAPVREQLSSWRDALLDLSGRAYDPSDVLRANPGLWARVFGSQVNANAAMALVDEDFNSAIARVKHPTHIIWGEADPVTPLRTGQLLNGRLANASLLIMPGVGHTPMATHADDFNAHLLRVLANPNDSRYANTDATAATPAPWQPLTECRNQRGMTISGRIERIVIDNCRDLVLENVEAEQITVHNASVTMTNVAVASSTIALDVVNSVVVATNASFSGEIGLAADGGRYDLAGVTITGSRNAVQVSAPSNFIFSVSDVRRGAQQTALHGRFHLHDSNLNHQRPEPRTPPAPASAPAP